MRILLFSFLLFLSPLFAFASEQVTSFTSDITPRSDGRFEVVETIVYDFGDESRHGIFRYIEKGHPQESSSFLKQRYLELEIEEVLMDGSEVPFVADDSFGTTEVKIGDALVTISNSHTYTIRYTVTGGFSALRDGKAELYWNVTGNGWEVPILVASARIHPYKDITAKAAACYKGYRNENNPCDSIEVQDDGSTIFSASELPAGSGLTVAQEIESSIPITVLERFKIELIAFIVLPIFLGIFLISGYRYRTKYKTGNTIIAEYEPYKNFKPMYAGMLFDGRLDPHDITAGIVYLAEQGFLKITKTEQKVLFMFEVDDYSIELRRPISEVENVFLGTVIELLFKKNAVVGDTVALSALKKDLAQQQANAKLLVELRKTVKEDMEKNGFFENNKPMITVLIIVGIAFFVTMFLSEVIVTLLSPVSLTILIILEIAAFIFALITLERRTKEGYQAQDHLKGFKLFLSVTDAERFKFHNAPQKSPEQFMEYLPYAIAFGVEKQWAKVFEGITIPNPGWYDGGSVGTFSAVNLTSSLGAFSTSFTASSGSSGSSGGGSSGGGGGGGGGGSW